MGKQCINKEVNIHKKGKGSKVDKKWFPSVFNSFIKRQEESNQDIDSNQIIKKTHKLIKKNQSIYNVSFAKRIKEKLKICRSCDKWNELKSIIQCQLCEDYYHKKCLKNFSPDKIICTFCRNGMNTINCKKCSKRIQPQQMYQQCTSCSFNFHSKCVNSKKMCQKCQKIQEDINKSKNLRQSNLRQYFSSVFNLKEKINQKSNFTVSSKKQARFVYNNLIKSTEQVEVYRKQLLLALKNKKMTYSQELIYFCNINGLNEENSIDFGLNHMTKEEKLEYQIYKRQPIGPFLMPFIEGKGFDVVADKDIPAKSLICEYIGQVVTLRECIQLQLFNKNDSIMELQSGKNSDRTLIIRPQKYANIARFINGVKSSSQGNIMTLKILYNGKPVVLLFASRLIKKGQSLCYDYNAGGISAKYDTSNFI